MESPTDAAAESRTAELHEPASRPDPARPIKKVRYGRQAFDPMEMVSHSDQSVVIKACKLPSVNDAPGGVSGTSDSPQWPCIC